MLSPLFQVCGQETLLPVMYDVQRRLQLMRATKAHVMRRGFGKHCRVISEVNTDQLLKAMALHGDNADLRELLRDPQVDVALKRALGGVLQATSSIIGMEGHRSQIRLRGHAAGWHYGSDCSFFPLQTCIFLPHSFFCLKHAFFSPHVFFRIVAGFFSPQAFFMFPRKMCLSFKI